MNKSLGGNDERPRTPSASEGTVIREVEMSRKLKRQNMRKCNTLLKGQVRSPSPIPVKLAPEVGIGPKTHHAKYFLIFVA